MSDFSIYKQLEAARISSNKDITTPAQPVSQSHQRETTHAIANLSATLAETPVAVAPYTGNFIVGNITAGANAVANSTDYTLVTLSKRTGANAAVVVATANLSNVAVTKFVPIAFTVANAANAVVTKGDVLTVTVALTGNGTANNAVTKLDFIFEDTA